MDFMKNTAIPSTLPEQIDAKLDLDKVKQECQELVKSRAKVSAGVAVVPVPFLDVAVDAGLLSKILPQITQKFQLIDDVNQLDESEDQLFKNLKDRALSFAGLVATRGMAKKPYKVLVVALPPNKSLNLFPLVVSWCLLAWDT